MKCISTMAILVGIPLCAYTSGVNCKPPGYWFDASLTYWFAKEDGLNVAESAQVDGTGTTVLASSPAVFQQEFSYQPGFKIGAGYASGEDWNIYGEYTYYRANTNVSMNAPAGTIGTGVWSTDNWYLQETFFSNQSLAGTALSTTWNIEFDMGDLLVSYPLSQRGNFSYAPFGGLRAIWIRQQMNLELNVAAASFGGSAFLGPQPVSSLNQSEGWGLGPRVGIGGRYDFSGGFSFEGAIGATLFGMDFTNITHSESLAATFYATPASLSMSYTCVRPEVDLSFGIGWTRNVSQNQRLSFGLNCDYSYFWGQNMMRHLMDEYIAGTSAGSLDLYFMGMSLSAAYIF